MNLGETIIYCNLGGLFFTWEHPCVACPSLAFFEVRAVLSMDARRLFPQCMLTIMSLMGSVTDVMVSRACAGY